MKASFVSKKPQYTPNGLNIQAAVWLVEKDSKQEHVDVLVESVHVQLKMIWVKPQIAMKQDVSIQKRLILNELIIYL